MTSANGRIAVAVRFPLFGSVVGEKPVNDLRSPPPSPEGSPVSYTPMSQPKVTAAITPEGPVVAPTAAEPAVAVPVAVAEKPAAPAPADSAEKNEAKAKSILGMAKTYMSAGMRDKAAAKLKDLVARYPDTVTAAEAKAMLMTMK